MKEYQSLSRAPRTTLSCWWAAASSLLFGYYFFFDLSHQSDQSREFQSLTEDDWWFHWLHLFWTPWYCLQIRKLSQPTVTKSGSFQHAVIMKDCSYWAAQHLFLHQIWLSEYYHQCQHLPPHHRSFAQSIQQGYYCLPNLVLWLLQGWSLPDWGSHHLLHWAAFCQWLHYFDFPWSSY